MLDTITENLRHLPNIVAVVFGGSQARRLARPDSDIDLGIYYHDTAPLPIDGLRSVAKDMSIPGSTPVVTGPYEWGEWVNGGAWIQTPVGKVDFLYKNLEQIRRVIDEGLRGIWRHDYDQQPPYGFRSIVYFGETRICLPLYDPEGEIARLKQAVMEYPNALKTRIVQECLWQADFTFFVCRTFVNTSDIYNTVGCMARVAQALVHALFALNGEYFVSDKYANRIIDQFTLRPIDFVSRLARILSSPGTTSAQLAGSVELLRTLWMEIVGLTAGGYEPRYHL